MRVYSRISLPLRAEMLTQSATARCRGSVASQPRREYLPACRESVSVSVWAVVAEVEEVVWPGRCSVEPAWLSLCACN